MKDLDAAEKPLTRGDDSDPINPASPVTGAVRQSPLPTATPSLLQMKSDPSAAPLRVTAGSPSTEKQLPLARPVTGDALRNAMAATTVAWVFGNVWVVATSNASITQFAK